MNKYKMIFKGKDYTLISDCLSKTEIYDDLGNKIAPDCLPAYLKLTDILISFLDSYNEGELNRIFKNLDDDEEEAEKAEKKKLYTKLANNNYMFNGQIGFLRKKDFEYCSFDEVEPSKSSIFELDISLRCISRFDDEEKGYFLCSMLLHNDLSFVDSLISMDNSDEIFEYLLLFRYIALLRDALAKGYYKKYVTIQNNDDRLKGSVDIARHIRLNSGYDNGKIAYSYRENTVKNPLNMLIVAAYQKLRSKFSDMMDRVFSSDYEEIINALKAELGFYDCTLSDLVRLNNKPIYHPYYFEYESMREVCLKILRDEGLNLFAKEENDESTGYLVYVPNLWEKYLQDRFDQYNQFNVEPQDLHKVVKSNNDKCALNIRPDFVFYKPGNVPKMMLDAKFIPKWKEASETDDFSKVSNDFNKCVRDMTCLEMHKTGVVFPCNNESLFKRYKINSNDLFYVMGINVPPTNEEETFYSWNSSFENGIKEQIERYLIPVFNSPV